jgi:putative membrane protein insertion efficiency factor
MSRHLSLPGVSRETLRWIRTVSRETVLVPVHAWRLISRLLPPRCRYYPSCSAYALTAVRRHGVIYGTLLAAYRVIRCNPWSLGGVDHVPPRNRRDNAAPEACGR